MLREVVPAWQAAPYEEDRRDRVLARSDTGCRWQSFTARQGAFAEDPSKRMYFEIDGPADARVRVEVKQPAPVVIEQTLGELAVQSQTEFVGEFTTENVQIDRLVLPESYEASLQIEDTGSGERTDYYYVRVTQANGQMAWTSPVWVDAE